MRLYQLIGVFIILAATFASTRAAEESTGDSAVVAEGKINVRGKPSLVGEVITQLERGEKVTILERITNSTAKPDEPTNWAKIKLPPNTPVWVFSPFVKDGLVNVSRLNVRAGRGENYSVIGRLNRGEAVKPIRTVEEWMEIEQPTNAFAFVDLSLLQVEGEPTRVPPGPGARPDRATPEPTIAQKEPPGTNVATSVTSTPPVAATGEVPQPAATSVPEAPTNVATSATPSTNVTTEVAQPSAATTEVATTETTPAVEAPKVEAATPETALPVPEPAEPGTNVVTAESSPASANPPTTGVTVATTSPLPQSLPEIAPPIEKKSTQAAKRVVRREGIVRATTSIQAPTWYELEHAETKKRINYLFADGMDINLKDYRGQKVVVTGEEAIDPRWPNTPILDMQTLDVLP